MFYLFPAFSVQISDFQHLQILKYILKYIVILIIFGMWVELQLIPAFIGRSYLLCKTLTLSDI